LLTAWVNVGHFPFANVIDDPRSPSGELHSLDTIITVAQAGILCGADKWVEIEEFGKAKLDLFQSLFGVAAIEYHHQGTFGRVFGQLDPPAFQSSFRAYTQQLSSCTKTIADNSKTLRGSHDTYHSKSPKHVVSAWANESLLILAQVATTEKIK